MVSIQSLMHSAANEALSSLGEPTRQAFLLQLKNEGIAFSANSVNLKGMESKLRQFFGVGSPLIMEKVHFIFMRKAMEAGYVGPDAFSILGALGEDMLDQPYDRQSTRKSS